jgi:hypothetical protein
MKEYLMRAESRENEIPEAVLDYLKNNHEVIINGYRNEDGSNAHCGQIAADIAALLLRSGMHPHIEEVCDREDNHMNRRALVPEIYNGKITWGGHQVCCCQGLAFDPLLGQPIAIEDYTEAVFGKDIELRVSKSEEETEKREVNGYESSRDIINNK